MLHPNPLAKTPDGSFRRNIRPVREVERHTPSRRRSRKNFLLPSPYRRWSTKNIRVGVAANENNHSLPWNGEVYLDDNRLTSIMNFQPLREAFGEFCRRSLCGEVRKKNARRLFSKPKSNPQTAVNGDLVWFRLVSAA